MHNNRMLGKGCELFKNYIGNAVQNAPEELLRRRRVIKDYGYFSNFNEGVRVAALVFFTQDYFLSIAFV